MMSKIFKNIAGFCIWLTALAICSHLLIPHDHHLGESFNNKEELCPVSTGKTGHNTGLPVHCHAFNDLVSEKVTKYVLTKVVQSDDILFCSFPDVFVFELQAPIITIFDIREPFPDPYLLELSALRAPPPLS